MLLQLGTVTRDRLRFMSGLVNTYGDALVFPLGGRPMYFVNDPALVAHVLVEAEARYVKGIGLQEARAALGDGMLTSEGEGWRALRHASAPHLRRTSVGRHDDGMTEHADTLVSRWLSAGPAPHRATQDLADLALANLGLVMFGSADRLSPLLGHEVARIQRLAMVDMLLNRIAGGIGRAPVRRRLRAVRAFVERNFPADEQPVRDTFHERHLRGRADGSIDHGTYVDELVTLIFTGQETTSTSLAWSLYELGRRPDWQRRLEAEARSTDSAEPRAYPLAFAFLSEVLRLYPPVWLIPRRAIDGDDLGGTEIPAGAEVLICPYTLHRRVQSWAAPDEFRPERFLEGVHADAYVPFGLGPRACIGAQLALRELTITLTTIVRRARITTCGRRRPQAGLSLGMNRDLRLSVTPR